MLRNAVALAVIAACAIAVTGCGIIEDSIGHPIYLRGAVNVVEKQPLTKVYEATKKAIKDIGYAVATDERETNSAVLQGENKFDRRNKIVRVILTSVPEGGTEISIRVGRTGNRTLSAKVLEGIRSHLK